MDPLYTKEKLAVAVHALATGKGGIKARLKEAFMSFHVLSGEDFPEELKVEWNYIYEGLTKEEPICDAQGEITTGKMDNTLRKMDEETGVDIAERIYDLDDKLSDYILD